MEKENEYIPQSIAHPGQILEEKIEEMGISIKEFSLRTEKPQKTIIAVLKGESAITNDMAIKFETVTKIPFSFWMNFQMKYDEFITRQKYNQAIKEAENWTKQFPYPQPAKLYKLESTRKIEEKTKNLFSFFGVASHKAWENLYIKSDLKVAAYASLSHTQEPHAISAWLRQGEIQAKKIEAPQYNKSTLKDVLPEMKNIMAKHPNDYFIRL